MSHSFRLTDANAAYIGTLRAYGAKSSVVNRALDRHRRIADGYEEKSVADFTTIQLVRIASSRLFTADTTSEQMTDILIARDALIALVEEMETPPEVKE